MNEKEIQVVCTHRNAINCRMTCSHREPHIKKPTDDEWNCTYKGRCRHVHKEVQCEEIKVC